jgi:hypothetical protein
MARAQSRGRKFRPAPPATRALIEKENQARFKQSLAVVRENGRMLPPIAAAVNIVPTEIPPALKREFRAAAKRASERAPHKPRRVKE